MTYRIEFTPDGREHMKEVWIVAIFVKRRNRLFVGGREIKVAP